MSSAGTKLALISPQANKSAIHIASFMSVLRPGTCLMCAALATISVKSPSLRIFHTGVQYTPVASIATCVHRLAVSQANNDNRPSVVVAKVRHSRVGLRPTISRTQATTVSPAFARAGSCGHRDRLPVCASLPFDLLRTCAAGVGASQTMKSNKRAPGVAALWHKSGSSRLRGSNSQPGSPAPWSTDLWPTAAPLYPIPRPSRFHPPRVGPRPVGNSQWQDTPAEIRHEAERTIMNFVGTALGGCREEAIDLALRALGPFFGPPQATVIGRSERPNALFATFLNAVSANVLEFDDTHLRTVIHPAAPVAPALFALSELRPVSGQELLHALVLGVETECRIGNAISPAHYRRGWHITSTCGVFGAAAAAAAAAGKLLRLDQQQSLGSRQCRGTIGWADREPRQHGEEHQRRRCRAQWAGRGAPCRARLHRTRAGD